MSTSLCKEWDGYKDREGYPLGHVDGKLTRMHRTFADGEVEGNDVHHTCGNKSCVNPEHLQVIDRTEHLRLHKNEFCKRGHPMVEGNLYTYGDKRRCRQCVIDRGMRLRHGPSHV
jgi:hypothetical protein